MLNRIKTSLVISGIVAFSSIAVPTALAQEILPDGRIVWNQDETDIRALIELVGKATGTNFVIDPRVKGKVTLMSREPMEQEELYSTFLAILQVHGYAAIPAGNVVKVVPEVNAKQDGGAPIRQRGAAVPSADGDIVTQVVMVQNVPAAQLVPILRPLVPQYGHLAAYPPSNMLIISDRAANVSRLMKIIQRIDQGGDEDIELVPLKHASASEVVRILNSLQQAQTAGGRQANQAGGQQMIADERTNSILLGGDRTERLRLKALIAHLDTPLEDDGNTQVIYLHYAKAENLAPILSGFASEEQRAQGGATGNAANQREVNIQPDADTNALVITAPPSIMRQLRSVIKQLDIRRAQVLVEAVIAEVSNERSAELGIQWAALGSNGLGITNFQGTGGSLAQVGALLATGGATAAAGLGNSIGDGFTYGAAGTSGNTTIGALVRALQGDGNTNILSTPSIMTMDNEEAEISIGQEVPFLTGSFSNTGANNGSVNPFQTIERRDVGLTLNITPQINEGNTVQLKISQEVSSVGSGTAGAADLITNKRNISTTVIVEDSQLIVLGGLIDDSLRENEQKVPILGDVPLLGSLFRYRTANKSKRNLMVFIKPTIIRNGIASQLHTNSKYNFIRDVQLQQRQPISLMSNEQRPTLLKLDEWSTNPSQPTPTAPAPKPAATTGAVDLREMNQRARAEARQQLRQRAQEFSEAATQSAEVIEQSSNEAVNDSGLPARGRRHRVGR